MTQTIDWKALLEDLTIHGGKYSHDLSLSGLVGKKVTDLGIGITTEFDQLQLSVHRVYFDDGTSLKIDGEHDIAYMYAPSTKIETTAWPTLKQSYLGPLYNTWNEYEPLDEDGEENEDYYVWDEDDD